MLTHFFATLLDQTSHKNTSYIIILTQNKNGHTNTYSSQRKD